MFVSPCYLQSSFISLIKCPAAHSCVRILERLLQVNSSVPQQRAMLLQLQSLGKQKQLPHSYIIITSHYGDNLCPSMEHLRLQTHKTCVWCPLGLSEYTKWSLPWIFTAHCRYFPSIYGQMRKIVRYWKTYCEKNILHEKHSFDKCNCIVIKILTMLKICSLLFGREWRDNIILTYGGIT